MSRILVVGDLHEPATHPGYLPFVRDIYEQWDCNEVVFIGDVVDHHAISFHAHHPEMPGPEDEYQMAYEKIQEWNEVFPKATCIIGNHDARVIRLAETVDIPARFLRDFADVWETPDWAWVYEAELDGVFYTHGNGQGGGKHPAYNLALRRGMSVVMGHTHTAGGVKWVVGPRHRWFALDTGCGVDRDALAMAYGKGSKDKPILGCGVILEGTWAFFEQMPMARGEAYHRSRWERKGS